MSLVASNGKNVEADEPPAMHKKEEYGDGRGGVRLMLQDVDVTWWPDEDEDDYREEEDKDCGGGGGGGGG